MPVKGMSAAACWAARARTSSRIASARARSSRSSLRASKEHRMPRCTLSLCHGSGTTPRLLPGSAAERKQGFASAPPPDSRPRGLSPRGSEPQPACKDPLAADQTSPAPRPTLTSMARRGGGGPLLVPWRSEWSGGAQKLEMATGTQNARRPAGDARYAGAAGMRAGPLGPQDRRGT